MIVVPYSGQRRDPVVFFSPTILTVLLRTKRLSPFVKKTWTSESLTCESTALYNHLLWFTHLLLALTKTLEQPSVVLAIQPILTNVLQHQKWVQALLTMSLRTLASNAILVRRYLAISSISSQVPKDTLRALRNSPLLEDLMFYISPKDLESLNKRMNERYMC